jgi:hypothetical protein
MPFPTSAIFVGDLAEALHKLQPRDKTTTRAIAGLLGFTWVGPARGQRTTGRITSRRRGARWCYC